MDQKYASLQDRLSAKASERNAWRRELTVVVPSVLAVLGFVFAWAWWMQARTDSVVGREAAGQVVSSDLIDAMIVDRTRVETDKGVWFVEGTFQAVKGRSLVLEVRRNGDKMLCDPAGPECRKLVE